MDKTRIRIAGCRLADIVGDVLATVCDPVVEVGPGVSRFASVQDEPPGEGPLAAIAAGWEHLRAQGNPQPALVLAADLPLISSPLLRLLAGWPGHSSVVPVVDGIAQPLCARWSIPDMESARERLTQTRSVNFLASADDAVLVDESAWGNVADLTVFADVDYQRDFERLGLTWFAPTEDDAGNLGP